MVIFSNFVTISLSVSIFLVNPSIEEEHINRRLPLLSSCFRMEEVPYKLLCLSKSLSIASMISIAFFCSFISYNNFLNRSSISPL